ncbi:MAG TPA: hypothetical protein VFI72_00925, partial [Candidatus Angelobacter sp.]|nr:hypothetical protein [Candidatus Angelobacter sp.]
MHSRFAAVIVLFVSLVPIACAAAQASDVQSQNQPHEITGDWQGTLDTGAGQLHLILHVSKAPDGSLKASLDSVDQGAHAIPVSSISLKGS